MKIKKQYDWLDLIRGLAALAVFIGHLRIICFRDVAPGTLDLLGKIVFFVTGFGHISVTIFFVLSGFLIIKSIHQSTENNNWNTVNYAENRFFRLWIVLIPCLFMGLLFDSVGLKYWGNSLFYSGEWKYFLHQDLPHRLSADIFVGNMFFLQKILVPTLGSNGALWSLTNEFWYYVIFPLFYFASINRYALMYRILCLIAGVMLLFFVGDQIAMNFSIWLMGGLSYILMRVLKGSQLNSKIYLTIFTGLFLVSALLLRVKFHEEVFNYYSVGFFFALSIPFLVHAEMRSNLIKSISDYFSNISYTLYLSHLPFIYIVTSMFGFEDKAWSLFNCVIFLGIVCLTTLYSTLLWFIFERNTKKVQAYVTGKYRPLRSLN